MTTVSTVKYHRINEVSRFLLKFCLSAIKVMALIMVSTAVLGVLLVLFFNIFLLIISLLKFIGF